MRWCAVVLAGALLAGCSAPVAGSPAPAPGKARALPVYFVATTAAGPRLQREFHQVTTADPASDAVRELFDAPLDLDYRTLWPSGTSLRSPVRVDGRWSRRRCRGRCGAAGPW